MNKKIFTPPYSVARKLPKGDKKYFPYFSPDFAYYHKNKSYLYRLRSCYITHYGPVLDGITFAPVLTSQMREKPKNLAKLYLSCIKKILLNKVKRVDKKCIVVHNNYVNNYYHWVLEIFFRLYLVKDQLADHTLILPKISFSFQQEMLKLLNIEVKNIIQIDPENLIKAAEVIIPQYPADYGNYEPKLLREYANWILSQIIQTSGSQPIKKNIYITRDKAIYRRIVNEEELVKKLKSLNFEVIYLENINFQEQVTLFFNAEIIVAPHGAGLTNLIYCKPQTVIVELLPEGYIHTCFYTLADVFDLNYYYIIGKDIKNSPSIKPYQYDMQIEVEALSNLLRTEIFSGLNKFQD